MGMMFRGTNFCPHCGRQVTAISAGQATTKSCPRCQVALQEVQVAKTSLDQCARCGGLWLDMATFNAVCSDAASRVAMSGLAIPAPTPLDLHVRYLPCPLCRNLMNRTDYSGYSGIVVNLCHPHGVWLDRDVMPQIIQFIDSGGLDQARKKDIEKLQQARRALESEQYMRDVGRVDRLDNDISGTV
jgi:Zn-finger nucleic acid-binding protein